MNRQKLQADVVTVALVGNPNVGKSTLFNALTGGKQHTGNWSGKTVSVAQGRYTYKGKNYCLVDLPGTYALLSQSEEERITGDYIRAGEADCTVIVIDATSLERNLSFAMQVMEIAKNVILCINLMDEAEYQGISLDFYKLRNRLSVPVVGVSAGKRVGLDELKETIRNMSDGFLSSSALCIPDKPDCEEAFLQNYSRKAAQIVEDCVQGRKPPNNHWLDRIVLGRYTGKLILLCLLLGVFWLTMIGANYPSMLLQQIFDAIGRYLEHMAVFLPSWIYELLIEGIYATTARVVSVMLPPMLIFFLIFSFLEDLGYLPRAAFLMDHTFEICGSCGKQVLTMSMGLGCNAVGVMGCRIISSPKERILSIITNSLVPCNGRFPALIALAYYIFADDPLMAAVLMTSMVLLSILVTFLSTRAMSHTLLRGETSHFIMEMPPYRKPSLKKIIVSAVKDRTVFVLLRAVMVAAPAGGLIWLLGEIQINGVALISLLADMLDPVGLFLGMNGWIMLAFVLSFPANELFLPLVVMMISGSALTQIGTEAVSSMFSIMKWSNVTALCSMIFVLFHWPCSTTCFAIFRETRSWKWTILAVLLPTAIGAAICFLLNICVN